MQSLRDGFHGPDAGRRGGAKKYDATAGSMIALLKYGNGDAF